MTFLDISYATQVTDDGLCNFKGQTLPITKLFVNGLTAITAIGLTDLVASCVDTLKVLEAGLMEQLTGQFCHPLSHAFGLEELDLTGDSNVSDEFLAQLSKGEIKGPDNKPQIVGLQTLRILKLSGLVKLSDHSLQKLCSTSTVMEHLEITKCEGITDYSLSQIIKETTTLKFIDLNSITAVTPQILEQLKLIKPDILIRRFLYQVVDPKDNELRVPRRVVDKKKKKKKKKGGKKKK